MPCPSPIIGNSCVPLGGATLGHCQARAWLSLSIVGAGLMVSCVFLALLSPSSSFTWGCRCVIPQLPLLQNQLLLLALVELAPPPCPGSSPLSCRAMLTRPCFLGSPASMVFPLLLPRGDSKWGDGGWGGVRAVTVDL